MVLLRIRVSTLVLSGSHVRRGSFGLPIVTGVAGSSSKRWKPDHWERRCLSRKQSKSSSRLRALRSWIYCPSRRGPQKLVINSHCPSARTEFQSWGERPPKCFNSNDAPGSDPKGARCGLVALPREPPDLIDNPPAGRSVLRAQPVFTIRYKLAKDLGGASVKMSFCDYCGWGLNARRIH
jgi:hypothetical protein